MAAESFLALSRRLGGAVGLAYAPLGIGKAATSMGDLFSGSGWSTMKVPVAIAAVEAAGDHPDTQTMELLDAAITSSDNAAAMQLWARLGPPALAAARTQSVLRAGGDATTTVPSATSRPGYTPFGQAIWSLPAQATFAASLPCLASTTQVLTLMGHVIPSQRWGVGSLPATVAFKGGWGPGVNGDYLVRQMAIVRLADGSRIGLVLAAAPPDGRFDTGVADLGELARWASSTIRTGGAWGC